MLRLFRRAALAAAAAAWALPADAQDFPSRPLRLMVSFPRGGGTDVLARVMAARFGEWLGQSVFWAVAPCCWRSIPPMPMSSCGVGRS